MQNYTNQILVPIDFSEQSLIALSQSYNIAKFHNCAITLLHVIDEDLMDKFKSLFKSDDGQDLQMREEIQSKLDKLTSEVTATTGLAASSMIAEGSIPDEVVRVSTLLNATFIIMGTNGASKFSKKFIGTNAWRIINEANCPVISIKGTEHTKGCKCILLPLDVTRESRDKVRFAIELAKYFNSDIALLSMYESNDEFVINKLKRQMDQVHDLIVTEGINCKADLVESKELGKTVLDYAKKIEADLILIMSQQDKDITEWFIGSTAQEIINNSDVPVLSLRPMKRKDMTEYTLS